MEFEIKNGVLERYEGEEEYLIIPDNVIVIGKDVFSGCEGLISVTIPESVIIIEEGAFASCRDLTDITIPEGVIYIGERAFMDCENLKRITLPGSIKSIREAVFEGCRSLNRISISADSANNPEYVATNKALYNKDKTELICAFKNIRSMVIPETVTTIKTKAFDYCNSLVSLTIPKNVRIIESFAFDYCNNLTDLTICEGPERIDYYAFSGCSSLIGVTIPASVKSIGSCAFRGCSNLSDITISEGVEAIGDLVFNCGNLNSLTIPESVEVIGKNALFNCDKLELEAYCVAAKTLEFSKDSHPKLLVFPKVSINEYKDTLHKELCAYGFIAKPEVYTDKKIINDYISYISGRKKQFLPEIYKEDKVQVIRLLGEAKKITKANIDEYIEPALKAKATRCLAYLKDLKNMH